METLETSTAVTNLNRREFLKASLVVAASATALSSFWCTLQTKVAEAAQLPEDLEAGGTWVNAPCWHNCGGRCVNKVMLKEGVVVRMKTDDSHEDSPDYPQQRGCIRGKAQQQQCFGADRILYPIKRKGWQPGGGANSNGQMRGRDEWERISWDEAIELICSELKRIGDEYGPMGFYGSAGAVANLTVGGTITGWETSSMGTLEFDVRPIGLPPQNMGRANDRFDMQNADYIIMWSSNPSWSAAALPTYFYIQAHEAGAKFIVVDPVYNATANMLDATWMPMRCGKDIVMMLAVAYEMLRLDPEEDLIDWDFLHKYTVGFDAESMPPDATIDENLKDYILGEYDGIPKTPEWAEPLCGTPANLITDLARILGKKNKTMILHNFAFSRAHATDMLPQMIMTLGTMGGHIGKSGHACADSYHSNAGNAGFRLVSSGSSSNPSTTNTSQVQIRGSVAMELIAKGGGTYDDTGTSGSMHEPVPTTIGPVKGIIYTNASALQSRINQKAAIEAYRAVDFVYCNAQFMTTMAAHADIVLPVTTEWERVGGVTNAGREYIYCWTQVAQPLGEAKTDQEIARLILEKYGIDPDLAYPKSQTQQFFEQIAGSTIRDDGEMKKLVTITASDIADMGVEGEPQEGIISMKDFIDNGGYQFKRTKDDGLGFIGWQDFVDDPEANPAPSNSGKIEIYCQKRYDMLATQDSTAYKPYPTYVVPLRGYETTFANNTIGGAKGEFPYLMYNVHYLRRSHTVFDNCPWLREAWPHPLWINRQDAEAKDIKDGDMVLITSSNGSQSIRHAAVLDFLVPGVVSVPHGAWTNIDEATGIDRAGSDNWLMPGEFQGFGVSAYNTQNINVEKYTGEALEPDWTWPPRFVSV